MDKAAQREMLKWKFSTTAALAHAVSFAPFVFREECMEKDAPFSDMKSTERSEKPSLQGNICKNLFDCLPIPS